MYRNHQIGVIVPAYNEEGHVGDVIREMPEFVDRIYAVDDRSTDGTWAEVLDAAETGAGEQSSSGLRTMLTDGGRIADRGSVHDRVGQVVPVRHHENRGAGGSIKTGYLLALVDEVDITVTVDGDEQMDLGQMTRLLDPIVEGRVEYAKGNRLLPTKPNRVMPTWRLFGNAVLTVLTSVASGYWGIMDPQNGYTAISREALETIEVEDLYEYYGYTNDVLTKLNVHNIRVGDVTMKPIYGDEKSSIVYTEYIPKVSGMLLRNFVWRLQKTNRGWFVHPLALSYIIGGIASALAAAIGVRSLYEHVGRKKGSTERFASSLTLFAVGCLCILFGTVFDIHCNEEKVVRIHD